MTREQAKTVLDLMLTTAHTTLCETEKDAIRTASELMKEQEHKDRMFHALEDDWKRLKELLKEQPEIVRCKDCKHHLECDYWIENGDDWFCAEGERRTDDG